MTDEIFSRDAYQPSTDAIVVGVSESTVIPDRTCS
jgi:Ser-tRNA(Ala) deacylase AlaX